MADRWLHITVDQITDRVGAEITPAERDALVAELGKRLADVEQLCSSQRRLASVKMSFQVDKDSGMPPSPSRNIAGSRLCSVSIRSHWYSRGARSRTSTFSPG
ncbi:hypothetical protein [Streptomyces klenkii]|uniref:hypothetical protein n=1 Tax=Streptomyces klenkii TaxID=1420899 RepID=UPI0034249EEB